MGCAALASAQNAVAPNLPANALGANAPGVASRSPQIIASDVSVLIVALDDLSAPGVATIPLYVPPTAPPPPVTPIAPIDGAPVAATPTGFSAPLWRFEADAQKKPKKTKAEKQREKDAEDAKIFNPDPVAITPYTPRGGVDAPAAVTRVPSVIVPGITGMPVAQPTIVRAPGADLAAQLANPAPLAMPAPGRSQLMAVPLRRVLVAQGYKDVQVVAPQSSAIVRAIGEGRLSPRVLDDLKRSLATLAAGSADGAPADIGATIAAGRAASRIGQATGYRAVIGFYVAAPTRINLVGAGAAPDATTQKVAVNMVVADAQRESVEPLQLATTGDSEEIWRETGAEVGAQLLDKTLRDWPATSSVNQPQLAQVHLDTARAALQSGDLPRAQDEINQSLALDGTRAEAYLLRGDVLNAINPGDGLLAYQKAVELKSQNGQDWARIAAAYAYAKTPDWRSAWDAGKRALSLNYDSAALRVTIATAQYGRADLFRKADYANQAEEAETDARSNLERALQLSPDDPTAVRLLARNLLEKKRYEEAARTLDRIAPRYPNDLAIQQQYATALSLLSNQSGREEDAFDAYSRVWKLSGQKTVVVDPATYRVLAAGFDKRAFNVGKLAVQLARGVDSRAILRESALIQLTKLKEEMGDAKAAINVMQPAATVSATIVNSRTFAADLIDQSLEAFQAYLDTGEVSYFQRGDNLYRTAVASLNSARTAQ